MGAYRSLSVFTLSIVPNALPAATSSPGFTSRFTRVMSPSCSTANAVMPTVTFLPSTFVHSWSFVYFNPAGMFISRCSLVEGCLHHDRLDVLAATIDEELRPHGG